MSRIRYMTTLVLLGAACQSSSATSHGDAGNLGEGDASSTGDATPDVQPTSCTAPSDCIDFPAGPAIACCIGKACVYGQAAVDRDSCVDASAQTIMASSYDQSCQKDSDCVAIAEGNFCVPGSNNGCSNAAINKSALTQYKADLAKTTAGVCYGLTGCPAEFGPCCHDRVCGANEQCSNVVAVDASAEAGSTSAADAGDGSADAERNEAGDAGAE